MLLNTSHVEIGAMLVHGLSTYELKDMRQTV